MTNPHNVDICVTCVSEKPPTLPLREELPSLGIEVIYNAQGTGAKASKHQSKKLVKRFREREQEKDSKGSRFLPNGLNKESEKQKYRKEKESELKVPRALSYESYERRLLHSSEGNGKDDSSSSYTSEDTTSTSKSSESPSKPKPKKNQRWERIKDRFAARKKEKKGVLDPPKTVEIPSPSPEEQAVKDAKNAFAGIHSVPSRDTEKSTSRSSSGNRTGSVGISSGHDPSTLSTTVGDSTNNNSSSKVEDTTTTTPSNQTVDFPDLLGNTESGKGSTTTSHVSKEENTGSVRGSSSSGGNSQTTGSDRKPPGVYSPPPSPSLRSNSTRGNSTITTQKSDTSGGEKVREFYDLTALPDDAKNVIFSSSSNSKSSKDASSSTSSRRMEERGGHPVPNSNMNQLAIPEIDDGYGHVVLDLSNVDEESVSARASSHGSFRGRTFGLETVNEDDILASPTEKTGHVGTRLEDFDAHSQNVDFDAQPQDDDDGVYEGVSYNDDEEDEAYPPPAAVADNQNQYSINVNPDEESVDESDGPEGSEESDSMVISPDESLDEVNSGLLRDRFPHSVSYSSSRPKVSFSQDVEEHYYIKDDASYDNRFGDGRMPYQIVTISDPTDSVERFYKQTLPTRQELDQAFFGEEKDALESQPSVTSYEDCFKGFSGAPKEMPLDSPVQSASSYGSESETSHTGPRRPYFSDDETDSERPSELGSTDGSSVRDGFVAALSSGVRITKELEGIMRAAPELASVKLPERDRLPLHVVCDRPFPERSTTTTEKNIAHALAKDVDERRRIIELVLSANVQACTVPDENGDLPVHLLARQLMEWEAQWYQKVYEKAQTGSKDEDDNAVAITKLYQSMSQTIDLVLQPVATNNIVCQIPGSVGYLLPLHIAAIFTVSYSTLQAILEIYPQAATSRCNLIDVHTFIPSNSTPLELHDRLSTDFPKWEIENDKKAESANKSTKTPNSKVSLRRSDLMFAYHPNIVPYRNDLTRIQRIESHIIHEATNLDDGYELKLSPPCKRLWIWLCTYDQTEQDDENKHNEEGYSTYADSVRHIVESLPMRNVRQLALVRDGYTHLAIDIATTACAAAIWKRLDDITENEIAVPVADMSRRRKGVESAVFNEWEETLASRLCLQGNGYVSVLCRSLFNIREDGFPTSFIFLPYKLVKDKQGRLGLASPKAAEIAMRFSDCLLELTCPRKIRHFLEKKSIRFLGQSLGIEEDDDWFEVEDAIKEQMEDLLSLYESGPAYFYFLDEFTGIPVVSNSSNRYPIKIADPVDLVRKVFPLMLTGMILMRGEKALSIIASILIDKNMSVIQKHWIDTAKDLIGYMVSPRTEWTNAYLHDLMPLKNELVDFIERGTTCGMTTRDSLGLSSEWVVELSSVRMLVEMHDPKHMYAGLRARHGGSKVMWTRNKRFLDASSRQNLFKYDFKTIEDLRESFSDRDLDEIAPLPSQDTEHTEDEKKSEVEDVEVDPNIPSGYEHLFGDLALIVHQNSSEKNDKMDKKELSSPRGGMESYPTTPPPQVRKSRYASASHPISLLTFDKDCELDEVLQLRIQLDEQEAKLDFLKDKLNDIKTAEDSLTKEEDELGKILDEVTDRKKVLEDGDSKAVMDARKLLLRLCDLEDRVLCKEIEVQQLGMEVSCLELESDGQDDDDDRGGRDDDKDDVEPEEMERDRGIPDEVTIGS